MLAGLLVPMVDQRIGQQTLDIYIKKRISFLSCSFKCVPLLTMFPLKSSTTFHCAVLKKTPLPTAFQVKALGSINMAST